MDNQTNGAETPMIGTEVPTPQVATEVDFPDEVLEALQGTVAQPATGDSQGDGKPEGKPAEPTLNDQWTARGGDLDDLYKCTIPLPEDQGTATLQELKNETAAYRKGQGPDSALEDDKTEFANEKLRAMQELTAVVASIPKEHQSEELKQQYTAYRQQYQDQQDQLLLSVIPEWSDQAVKAKDAKEMVALAGEYGLPAAALDQLTEAGWVKLLYDFAKLKVRIAGIKGKQRQARTKGSKVVSPQSTTRQDRINSAVAAADRGGDKVDAIAQLLSG